MKSFLLLSILSCFLNFCLVAKDWSNWLGPNYDGSVEEEINTPKNNKELSFVWKIPVGKGWSSPIVSEGLVYLHDRTEEKEYVTAWDLVSGEKKWNFSYRSGYRDSFGMEDGPRSTPAIREKILITHGPQGLLHALDSVSGKLIWRRDLKKDFGSPQGFFGRCSSPLIIKDRVILGIGGDRVGVAGFSLRTGKTLWTGKPYSNDYASIVPLNTRGDSFVVAFMKEGLVVIDVHSGNEIFFDKFRSPIRASVNAATPLVLESGIFLSSCYDVGAGFWSFSKKDDHSFPSFESEWKKHGILDCHYSTAVSYQGFLYGFHGRQERGTTLRCVRIIDGKVMWSSNKCANGNLIRVGNKIISLTETGELIIFKADENTFTFLFKQQILGTGRAHFAYSNGKLFARDNRRLVSIALPETFK